MIEKRGLEAVRRRRYAMSVGGAVEIKEIYPGRSILYGDWESLARHQRFRGGVTVGFTVFGVGISLKWERSIESFVWSRLKEPAWDWQPVPPLGKEMVIEAHLTVLLRHGTFAGLESGSAAGNGDDWVLVILRRLGVPEIDSRKVWETGAVAAILLDGARRFASPVDPVGYGCRRG